MANSNNNLIDVFNDIATAINGKGVSGTMSPVEMADKIAAIPSGELTQKISSTLGKITEQTPGGNWYIANYSANTPILPCTDADTLLSINLNDATSFRFISKFKVSLFKSGGNDIHALYGTDYGSQISSQIPFIQAFNYSSNAGVHVSAGTGGQVSLRIDYNLATNTWYYVALRCVDSASTFCLYDASGTILGSQTGAFPSLQDLSVHPCIGGCAENGNYRANDTIFNLDECYIEKNGTALWGSTNSKTANMGIITSS